MINKEKNYYETLAWALIIFGVGLRLLLFWINTPLNAYDTHFKPIELILNLGALPAKDACWQCYHPPVFYVVSATVAKLASSIGFDSSMELRKILQFVGALYGMLTLVVIHQILKKLPLSNFARLLALGTVCFLPRHIYMSALHSNDTLAYLAIAVSAYLMLIAIERKLSYPYLILLSLSTTVAIFTKYTSFIILPALFSLFTANFIWTVVETRKKTIIAAALVLLLPLSLLGAYASSNIKDYGKALPWNDHILDTNLKHPHAKDGVSFINIKPWTTIKSPIITPDNIDSFWTLVYSRMWFDMEPKFLYYTDPDLPWWEEYFHWLKGDLPFPSDKSPLSAFTLFIGRALIALGLVPLFLIALGATVSVFRWWKCRSHSMETLTTPLFIVLLLANAAGMFLLGLKAPVYSSMKAVYFLNALPAFSLFLGFGVMVVEEIRYVRYLLASIFGLLFLLVTIHILHIVISMATFVRPLGA